MIRKSLILLLLTLGIHARADEGYEVIVYGATPAGIIAAVAASREHAKVLILEPGHWIGGMVAGGLSSSDLGREETIGGLAREFFERCGAKYGQKVGWYSEPHVYQETFSEMLREAKVTTITDRALVRTRKEGSKIASIEMNDGSVFSAPIFVDASYEGDLLAQAGVRYIVGRESRETYGETLAGFRLEQVRDFSKETMSKGCPCVGEDGPHYVHGAPCKIRGLDEDGRPIAGVVRTAALAGSGDGLTQAYNFRFCATQRRELRVPWPKPDRYDPRDYELLVRLIAAYPDIRFSRLVHLGKLANGKFDLNAQGLMSTDYVGANTAYPDGDQKVRRQSYEEHRTYLQGYFWFLSHDERVPARLRAETQSWGLCKDEFTDNQHWPYALYVREARRMIGEKVMIQQDVQRSVRKTDSVGMGSFIIDSHIVQRTVDADGNILDEGAFDAPTRPYAMPYRCLTPRRDECVNLLVPVCLSASHVAYCSIRMEPVYMAMGHAAGVAAAMSIRSRSAVQDINVEALQRALREQKQILELPGELDVLGLESLKGIVVDDADAEFVGAWTASSFGGGGVEGSSRHDMNSDKGEKSAKYTVKVPTKGRYEVRISYTPAANRASNVPIAIQHDSGVAKVTLNERSQPNFDRFFEAVGTYEFDAGKPYQITISNTQTDGYVVADAVQLIAVP